MKNEQECRVYSQALIAKCLETLDTLNVNPQIQWIFLSNVSLGDVGAYKVAVFLSNNNTLRSVDMRGCDIGIVGLRALAWGVFNNHHLRALKLGHNPLEYHAGGQSLLGRINTHLRGNAVSFHARGAIVRLFIRERIAQDRNDGPLNLLDHPIFSSILHRLLTPFYTHRQARDAIARAGSMERKSGVYDQAGFFVQNNQRQGTQLQAAGQEPEPELKRLRQI